MSGRSDAQKEALARAIQTARTEVELVDAMWRATRGDTPPPTPSDLAAEWAAYPLEVLTAADTKLTEVMGHEAHWVVAGGQLVARGAGVERTVLEVHARWGGCRAGHPLVDLVRAHTATVTIDERGNGIFPRTLIRQATPAFGRMPVSPLPEKAKGIAVPRFPLTLDHPSVRGRGAPLELRLWVEIVLSTPRTARQGATLAVPLRDLVAWLWPRETYRRQRDGARLMAALQVVHNTRVRWTDDSGRPAGRWAVVALRNLPDLSNRASTAQFDVRLPPGSEAGPLVHRRTLRKYGIESALGYRLALGLACFWNAHLTFRGNRIPATVPVVTRNAAGTLLGTDGTPILDLRGAPVTHWADPRASRTGVYERNPELRRLPWLGPEELLVLGLGEREADVSAEAQRKRLERLRLTLRQMDREGDIVLVEEGRRVRVEPPDWWGDPDH